MIESARFLHVGMFKDFLQTQVCRSCVEVSTSTRRGVKDNVMIMFFHVILPFYIARRH